MLISTCDAKTNFFTTDYRFAETGFLSIIEIFLFETTDERLTGQAYAKSHVGIT